MLLKMCLIRTNIEDIEKLYWLIKRISQTAVYTRLNHLTSHYSNIDPTNGTYTDERTGAISIARLIPGSAQNDMAYPQQPDIVSAIISTMYMLTECTHHRTHTLAM